ETSRDTRVARSIGVGPNAKLAHLVSPAEQLRVGLVERRLRGGEGAVRHPHHFARDRREVASEDTARPAIESKPISLRDFAAVDAEASALEIDVDVLAANDRALSHPPRDYSGVARHSTARGEHRPRGDDAVEVLGRRFIPNQDHILAGENVI